MKETFTFGTSTGTPIHAFPCLKKTTNNWWLLSHCAAAGLSAREATIHLLKAFFEDERNNEELDRFHFIADVGSLPVGDLHAIAREVWSDTAEE